MLAVARYPSRGDSGIDGSGALYEVAVTAIPLPEWRAAFLRPPARLMSTWYTRLSDVSGSARPLCTSEQTSSGDAFVMSRIRLKTFPGSFPILLRRARRYFLRKQWGQNPGVGRVEVVFLQPADRDQHNLFHFRRTRCDVPTAEPLAQRVKSLFGKTPVVEVEPVGPRFLRNIRDRIGLSQSDDFDLNPEFLEHLAPEARLDDIVA